MKKKILYGASILVAIITFIAIEDLKIALLMSLSIVISSTLAYFIRIKTIKARKK